MYIEIFVGSQKSNVGRQNRSGRRQISAHDVPQEVTKLHASKRGLNTCIKKWAEAHVSTKHFVGRVRLYEYLIALHVNIDSKSLGCASTVFKAKKLINIHQL